MTQQRVGLVTDTFTIVMTDGRKFRRDCTEGEASATFEGLTGASYLLDSVGNFIAGDYRTYLLDPH